MISTICIFFLFILLAVPAYAAQVQVIAEPAQLTQAGAVTVQFVVTNDSNTTMSQMYVAGHGLSSFGPISWRKNDIEQNSLEPGAVLRFSAPNIQIAGDMLGQPLVYTLTWSENGAQRSQQASVVVGPTATTPAPTLAEMAATRSFSKNAGKAGDKITITYTLKNPAEVAMTNITVKDSIAGANAIKAGFSIDPGGSTTVTYEYTLGAQDAISEPTITYSVNGENKSLKLEKATLAIVNLKLTTNVSMGEPLAEGVLFTITIKNTGNQTISGITVKDELGNAVNTDAFTLQAGQEKLLSYLVPPAADTARNVYFSITGKDAQNQPYEDKTSSYEVRPYIDPSSISLQLFTNIVENLNESGKMKVRFTIQNNSIVDLSNATISEAQLGEVVSSIAILARGETEKEVELTVGQPRDLEFILKAQDPSSAEHSYTSKITAALAEVVTPTPPPAATPTPNLEEEKQNNSGMSDTLITVLIVLAALMAVAGIALLVLSMYERRKNTEMDVDADGYARAPRAQGGAVVERAEPAAAIKEKKNRRHADDADDYDEPINKRPRNAVSSNNKTDVRPKEDIYTETRPRPSTAPSHTQPAAKPTHSAPTAKDTPPPPYVSVKAAQRAPRTNFSAPADEQQPRVTQPGAQPQEQQKAYRSPVAQDGQASRPRAKYYAQGESDAAIPQQQGYYSPQTGRPHYVEAVEQPAQSAEAPTEPISAEEAARVPNTQASPAARNRVHRIRPTETDNK